MTSSWARAGAVGAMMLTAVVAVDAFGAPSSAQQAPATPIIHPGSDTAPVVSDNGNVVVFRSATATGVTSIVVHNRLAAASKPLPGGPFGAELGNPAVSGDGCVIAVATMPVVGPNELAADDVATTSVLADAPSTSVPGKAAGPGVTIPGALHVVDRCSDPANPVALAPIEVVGATSLSTPALSLDGSTLVVSTGQEIVRYQRDQNGAYAAAGAFDGPNAASDAVLTSGDVDVSADGSVVVFAAGPNLDDPASLSVNNWVGGVVSSLAAGAWSPTISGDARIVAYQNRSGVVVRDRITPGAAAIDLAAGGARPSISADGNHVAYEAGSRVRVASWTGQGPDAYDAAAVRDVPGVAAPTGSGPEVDGFGTAIVTDSAPPDPAVYAERNVALSATSRAGEFDSDTFDLGAGDIGARLASTVTFTNKGPSSFGVGSIVIDAPFVIDENRCVGAIRPASTCSIAVSITIERYEDVFGSVVIQGASAGDPSSTAELVALGEEPDVATTTSTTNDTTTGGTTSGGTTTGGTTRGTTTGGRTTGGRTTGGTTTGGRTTGGRTTTTTTIPQGVGIVFAPVNFDFAPTIIEAGRRTGSVELVNTSTRTASIVSVQLETESGGDSAFEITATTCSGTALVAGSRCSVELAFTPVTTGAHSVKVVAQLGGGVERTALITGTGAPLPVLDIVPGVANIGQVVTLRGSGFPTGATLAVVWGDEAIEFAPTVDEAGNFSVPVVVMPHTPTGPVTVLVRAQTDAFPEVSARLLVQQTSDRTSPGVIGGAGPNVGR